MKYNKKELIEAIEFCVGDKCDGCPYEFKSEECFGMEEMLEQYLPETPVTDAFDHDLEVEPISETGEDNKWKDFCDWFEEYIIGASDEKDVNPDCDIERFGKEVDEVFEKAFKDEKNTISPTRKPFVERDLLLDRVIDAQNILESWEAAWSETQKQMEDDRKEIKDRQLKEIDELYSSEHSPCSRDFDIRCMELLKDHAMEWDAYHKDVDDAKKFYEDKKDVFVNNLFKAKEELKKWDDTHDPCTGELKEEPTEEFEFDEEFEKAARDYAEFMVEMIFGPRDEFEENWAEMQEQFPFEEALRIFGELNDEEIEAAKKIKTFDDAVDWLVAK